MGNFLVVLSDVDHKDDAARLFAFGLAVARCIKSQVAYRTVETEWVPTAPVKMTATADYTSRHSGKDLDGLGHLQPATVRYPVGPEAYETIYQRRYLWSANAENVAQLISGEVFKKQPGFAMEGVEKCSN